MLLVIQPVFSNNSNLPTVTKNKLRTLEDSEISNSVFKHCIKQEQQTQKAKSSERIK